MTILPFLLSAATAAMPGDEASWSTVGESPVRVECTEVDGEPWCRSFGLVHAPLEQVSQALKNMRYSADLFESVVSIDIISDTVLHVVLDYPAPLDDRDYVASYTFSQDGDAHLFTWVPASDEVPVPDGVVRLPRFAGEWRLEPRDGGTWVRYTWQGEINGSFPSFAYTQARKKAGYEALKDLAHTQRAELTKG